MDWNEIIIKLKKLWADRRGYKKRLILSLCAVFAACFTFLFFGPLEMVAFSEESLAYSYKDVIWILIIFAAVVLAVLSCIMALLRGKIFNYTLCSVFSLTVCGYLQAALFNGDLTALTGTAIDWTTKAKVCIINFALWLAVFILMFLIMHLHRKIWANMIKFVSLLLVVMQIIPTIAIVTGSYSKSKKSSIYDYSLTDENINVYSKKDNIFVFVLDTLDYQYIEEITKNDPDFFERLDGFTSYTNAVSAFARTMPALCHIMTGCEDLAYNVSLYEYFDKAWTENGKNPLKDLSDAGYGIEMYANLHYLFSDADYANEYVQNITDGKGRISVLSTVKKLTELSIYRYSPLAFKPFFWADTNYFNDVFEASEITKYVTDDAIHMKKLENAQTDGSDKKFKFYYFYGSHKPYNLNEDGTRNDSTTSVISQTKGCFNNLYAAFDEMKRLGIYEDATIIITADHGDIIDATKPLLRETKIGLFYKPSASAGTPLAYSDAPVSTDNISATFIKAAGADHSAYGKALDEINKDDQIERYYYKSISEPTWRDEYELYKYKIPSDASVFENWKLLDIDKDIHNFF